MVYTTYKLLILKIKINDNYSNLLGIKLSLIDALKNDIFTYLKSKFYPENVIKQILSEDFTSPNPSYYPYLFKEFFNAYMYYN